MDTVKYAFKLFFQKIDWMLLTLCTALAGLSVVLLMGIYNFRQVHGIEVLRLTRQNIVTQGSAIIVGLVAVLILANIDYRAIAKQWKVYLPVAYVFFLLTFVPGLGVAAAGRPDDMRWLQIPGIGMTVQPSEFLKLAFILSFAYHVYKTQDKFNRPLNVALLCLHALIPTGLVLLQGDAGTALMFFLIFVAMLFVAGIKWVYILLAALGIAAMIPVVWFFLFDDMHRNRILNLLAPAGTDLGWQQERGMLSIAAGRVTGRGIFSENHIYVPEMHNDFIFSYIGSALGFLGCIAICVVIAFIGVKMLTTCGHANDRQGQVVCAGVFAMIIGQSVINIGMNLSLLPVIGNSLPFLSGGGSSLLANYLGIGLVMSVHKHTRRKQKVENFLPGRL